MFMNCKGQYCGDVKSLQTDLYFWIIPIKYLQGWVVFFFFFLEIDMSVLKFIWYGKSQNSNNKQTQVYLEDERNQGLMS